MEEQRFVHCVKFLKSVKERGKFTSDFRVSLTILQEESARRGLNADIMKMLMLVIRHTELPSRSSISLVKCMIPMHKFVDKDVEKMIAWCLSNVGKSTVTLSSMMLQWIIGCWEYQLANRKSINMFYDVFFHHLLKYPRLESYLARLIYAMTRPEDVTRRQVLRLATLNAQYRKPQRHLNALLSLFKSYKPELVPENIPAVNVQSVWRILPDEIRIGFEEACERMHTYHPKTSNPKAFDWNVIQGRGAKRKMQEQILPTVGYFNIGSSIFEEKDSKSIFDPNTIEEFGKYHASLRLPCHATSLLANTIGYHLLTFANLEYQERFIHNLYYTLWKAFIFETGKFTENEMNRLLEMTTDFCRYMQHGIPIVNYFINEYLYCNTGEFVSRILELLEWSSVSETELHEYILKHIKTIFYESTIKSKCKVISTLKNLMLNMFVNRSEKFKNKVGPFLGQHSVSDLTEIIPTIAQFTKELIISGLNIHSYDLELLSESLTFYEEACMLVVESGVNLIVLAPPSVIYGGFVTSNIALMSRVCVLLLQYRKIDKVLKHRRVRTFFKNEIELLMHYAQDLLSALWNDDAFSGRHERNRYYLKLLSDKVFENLPKYDYDNLINVEHHCAVLPYKFVLSSTIGLPINTKEFSIDLATHYYPQISRFLFMVLGKSKDKSFTEGNPWSLPS